MNTVNVQVDNAQLLLRLRNGEKRLAYGVTNAINRTVRRIQAAERENAEQGFTIRRQQFVLQNIAVIKPFASATQGRPYAEIAVGQKPRLLLSIFERGGARPLGTPGAKSAAVPIIGGPARPTFASQVPADFTFKSLSIVKVREGQVVKTKSGRSARERSKGLGFRRTVTSKGNVQYKGAHRTFILKNTVKAPAGGVFQRIGPGRDDIRMVYSFKKDEQLKGRLNFVAVANQESARWFKNDMESEVVQAIARDGGRSVGA